ncbi:MAG: transcriptional repressor [Candidatus Brocadiia bacterium]
MKKRISPPKRRRTRQRMAILEELCSTTLHPNVAELYGPLKSRLPSISMSTLYRNLDALRQAGDILELQIPGHNKRYDGRTTLHYHVICERCGAVRDVPEDYVSLRPGLRGEIDGFELTGFRLDFIGICPSCRNGGSDARARSHVLEN